MDVKDIMLGGFQTPLDFWVSFCIFISFFAELHVNVGPYRGNKEMGRVRRWEEERVKTQKDTKIPKKECYS